MSNLSQAFKIISLIVLVAFSLIAAGVIYFSKGNQQNQNSVLGKGLVCAGLMNRRVFEGQLDFSEITTPMDAFVVSLSSTEDGLLVTSLNLENRNQTSPLTIFKRTGDFEFMRLNKAQQPVASAYHARHAVSIHLVDDKMGIFIADHGPDQQPFPGAYPILLIWNEQQQKWVDESSQRLPQNKAFTYHIGVLHNKKLRVDDVILGNIITLNGLPVYLANNGKGVFKIKNLHPEVFSKESTCIMSVRAFASEVGKSENKIYAGGCDSNPKLSVANAKDWILTMGKDSNLRVVGSHTLRLIDATWGTADMTFADFNSDGFTDVVLATHNNGFTKGGIQVLYQQPRPPFAFINSKPQAFASNIFEDSFIPWVKSGDVDGDGLPDVIFAHRPNPFRASDWPVKIFLNQKGAHFIDASECVKIDFGYIMAVEINDFNGDGAKDIFFLGPKGQYKFIY